MAANNNNKNRPSNYVILTLQATREGEMRYSTQGNPWANLRAFLSQGKDNQTGEYKPSLWFDVKAFGKDGEPTEAVTALSSIANKERFTVKGRLAMREWEGDDGVTRQKLEIFAVSVEPFSFGDEQAPADAGEFDEEFVDDLEGEPA